MIGLCLFQALNYDERIYLNPLDFISPVFFIWCYCLDLKVAIDLYWYPYYSSLDLPDQH